MDLIELFDMQKQLDKRIHIEHGLEGKNLLPSKILALQVELGELANETRCFKFWSNKMPSPKDVILEEYVDCLHFILSIGLDRGLRDVKLKQIYNSNDLTDQFRDIFTYINTFQYEPTMEHYEKLFNQFLLLGRKLEFTEEEIFRSYLEKNRINHERQDQGY